MLVIWQVPALKVKVQSHQRNTKWLFGYTHLHPVRYFLEKARNFGKSAQLGDKSSPNI